MKACKSAAFHTSVFLLICLSGTAAAQTCYAPQRPFVPTDPDDVQEYRDLIGRDFETYIADIQSYFRCLEAERARAFEEAHEVSEEYGRFLQISAE
ncbi:hypothetical protein ACJ5NV_14980 [Loktanella agnita]|uniref:hypothetical protein n=1 Tax=Loktanella agnita TaxID=287097 RepID=UPI0039880450